jgi:hypothetical protein
MSELIPIREFIDHHLEDNPGVIGLHHDEQFARAGYIPIHANPIRWDEIHKWLGSNYPHQYTWTGNTFWFDDSRIAATFALRFV